MKSLASLKTKSNLIELETIFEADISSSSSEPPSAESSTLYVYRENPKVTLYNQGLYSPGSGELCAKYIPLSDSEVLTQAFPSLFNPGIVEALFDPPPQKEYTADGRELYIDLCGETEMAPVRLFHDGLLKNVINLKYYCVNPNGVRNMCLALEGNTIVQRLDLTSSFLNNDACYHLGVLISNTDTLKELILAQCRIGYSGLNQLIRPLNEIKLMNLDLCKNQLGDDGASLLADKIVDGAKIKRLNLSHNNFGLKAFTDLAYAFEYNKTCFTDLDLSRNLLSFPKAIKSLITALYDNHVLVSLNLSSSGITGGPFLADILMAKSLKKLDLSYNRLSAQAVASLRSKLRTTQSLMLLNLSFNPLVPKEAFEMLRAMSYKQVKLRKLLMDGIDVTKEFPVEMTRILSLKYRENTIITHGRVMSNYTLQNADFRDILMKRLNFLGRRGPKKNRIDIPAYFLQKAKTTTVLMPKQMIMDMKKVQANIDATLIESLTIAFPGPMTENKTRPIDLESLVDYIARKWPDAVASPTPPTSKLQLQTPTQNISHEKKSSSGKSVKTKAKVTGSVKKKK